MAAGKLAGAGIVLVVTGWSIPVAAGADDLALDLGVGSAIDLRRIPKGSFVQGSPTSDPLREADESPQRTVTISRSFWLGRTPVTRGQFSKFVSETRHVTDAEKGSGGVGWDGKTGMLVMRKDFSWRNPGFAQKEEEPVVLVSFGDATAFTAWASRKTGRRIRLPTEAEWEYAARGGTTTPWYGAAREEEAFALGWFRTNASGSTHPVGSRKANPFGLLDVAGNVQEWCRDVYGPYSGAPVTDPESTTNATAEVERRVLRGGSWIRDPRKARSAARNKSAASNRSADAGFRIAAEDDEAHAAKVVPSSTAAVPATPSAAAPSATPPAPLGADAAPTVALPPPRAPISTESASWTLLVAPAAAAGLAVAWVLARKRRPTTTKHAKGVTTRTAPGGFWVHAEGLEPGARMQYTCTVRGGPVTDVVRLEPIEDTYVDTDGEPKDIRVLDILAPAVESTRGGAHVVAPAPPSARAIPTGASPWPSSRALPAATPLRTPGPVPAPLRTPGPVPAPPRTPGPAVTPLPTPPPMPARAIAESVALEPPPGDATVESVPLVPAARDAAVESVPLVPAAGEAPGLAGSGDGERVAPRSSAPAVAPAPSVPPASPSVPRPPPVPSFAAVSVSSSSQVDPSSSQRPTSSQRPLSSQAGPSSQRPLSSQAGPSSQVGPPSPRAGAAPTTPEPFGLAASMRPPAASPRTDHPQSVTGPAMPRHALLDVRESERPFRAPPPIEPEEFVDPGSAAAHPPPGAGEARNPGAVRPGPMMPGETRAGEAKPGEATAREVNAPGGAQSSGPVAPSDDLEGPPTPR